MLVLLQRALNLECLPTGVTREGLQVKPQVSLQFFCTGEAFATLRTTPAVALQVDPQVLVELFWEGEFLLTVGTAVGLPDRFFLVRHHVPL